MSRRRATSSPPASSNARAFTLVEMLAALVITTILLMATASTILLASKGVPDPLDAPSSAITSSGAVDQIAGELETALLVLEQTSTAITFTVPNRSGGTAPVKIRYSWTGVPGAPLLRQYNNNAATTFVDKVYQFALTPTITTSTESYYGVATEDAADTLLVDDSAATSLTTLSVTSGTWQGQYFKPGALPAGVVGWRPTRLQFMARIPGLLGAADVNVQMCVPNASLAPTTVIEQYGSGGLSILGSYAWQSFNFSRIDRLAPAAGICMVAQGNSGSMDVQANAISGLLQTSNSGSTWSYAGNKSLQSQLYGTLTRSGPSQYVVSKYLTALSISLRAGRNTNAAVQATAEPLNHPEMLSAFWELKFDTNPTTIDLNGDGQPDWAVHSGGAFNVATLLSGIWQANGAGGLDSQPADNFSRLTVIDVRFRATSSGSWAGIALNAARNGSTCAPVLARIALQADGTQTLTVSRKLSDATTDTLIAVPNLPPQTADLHLIIDPAFASVGITVNGVQCGTFAYKAYVSSDTSQSVSLTSSGSAEFDYLRVREVLP